MNRVIDSKIEKQTIYELYRGCRLCGAGGGYKMPIIQNVVDIDRSEVELKQKIRECVQIEVHQDDKMPPLICELCVDKINDFFEFLEMCRQTNKQTRLRLGLPPQAMPQGVPDAEDCILGVTEPVYVTRDTNKSTSKEKGKSKVLLGPKSKRKDRELIVKLENNESLDREVRLQSKHSASPCTVNIRASRGNTKDEDAPLQKLKSGKDKEVKISKELLNLLPENSPRLKRIKEEHASKRVRISPRPCPKSAKHEDSPKLLGKRTLSPKPILKRASSPKRAKRVSTPEPVKPAPSPSRPQFQCDICSKTTKNLTGLKTHMICHDVTYTNVRWSCNACGEWFENSEAAADHHKGYHRSRPYKCRRCSGKYKNIEAFNDHLDEDECLPWDTVPDAKCDVCWRTYPTNKLLDEHKCQGLEGRPGGKCKKCKRSYTLLKSLKKHESLCTYKRKGDYVIDDEMMSKLRPFQVRTERCDSLLKRIKWGDHYDVATVDHDFGIDKNCHYPFKDSYLKSSFTFDSWDHMVNIADDSLTDFYESEEDSEFVYWDSKFDSDNDDQPLDYKRQVRSLVALTMKVVFSKKCIGRVPKRRKGDKAERLFDSMLNTTEDHAFKKGIDNIIDNLETDDNVDGDDNHSKLSVSGSDENVRRLDKENDGVKETNHNKDTENKTSKANVKPTGATERNSYDTINDSNHEKGNRNVEDRTKDSILPSENSVEKNNKSEIVANGEKKNCLHNEETEDKKLVDAGIGETKNGGYKSDNVSNVTKEKSSVNISNISYDA